MTLNEVTDRLDALRRKNVLEHSDKKEIEELYPIVLDKSFVKTSCNDCYRDAVIEMILFIKRNGKMKEKTLYALKNGALIQMEFGSGEMYTNSNLTDEVAERFLAAHPNGKVLFSKLPEDWAERVQLRRTGSAENIIESAVTMLEDGESVDEVKKQLKTQSVDGKRITKKVLNDYVEEAVRRVEE
jgi:hypothetical protein